MSSSHARGRCGRRLRISRRSDHLSSGPANEKAPRPTPPPTRPQKFRLILLVRCVTSIVPLLASHDAWQDSIERQVMRGDGAIGPPSETT